MLVAINRRFEGGKKYYFLVRQGGLNGIGSTIQVLQIYPSNPKALLNRLTRVKKSGQRLSPQASGIRWLTKLIHSRAVALRLVHKPFDRAPVYRGIRLPAHQELLSEFRV
jgi:hypothetical protein